MIILLLLIFVAFQNGSVDGNVDLAILIVVLVLSILTLYIVYFYGTSGINKVKQYK